MESPPAPPLRPPWPMVIAPVDTGQGDMRLAEQLVGKLMDPDLRLDAFVELARKRDTFKDLAPLLWNSVETMAIILEEIQAMYPILSLKPPTLTIVQRNRVCNVIVLLKCLASDPRTKLSFRKANIPISLLPFLKPSHNFLRLTSLHVIGAFVRVPDPETIDFLISSEMIPPCLQAMETGDILSKTVATYIVHNFLLADAGLNYACLTVDRFFNLNKILGDMVTELTGSPYPSHDLLLYVVACYIRLSDHPNAYNCLKAFLPTALRDDTFANCIQENWGIRGSVKRLLKKLQSPSRKIRIGGWFGFDPRFHGKDE